MASATHFTPTSLLSVIVPSPRIGIRRPLLSVTNGIEFFCVLVSAAANDRAPPRLKSIAEVALICKNWRRLIPSVLRSLCILEVRCPPIARGLQVFSNHRVKGSQNCDSSLLRRLPWPKARYPSAQTNGLGSHQPIIIRVPTGRGINPTHNRAKDLKGPTQPNR